MQTMFVQVHDYIHAYSEAENPIDPLEALKRFLYDIGFEQLMAQEIQNPFAEETPITIYDGPPELAERWSKKRGELHDIGVLRTLSAERASTWADLRPLAKGPAREIFDDLEEFGMTNGLSIPYRSLDRKPMLVSIAGDAAIGMTQEDIDAIQILVGHFLTLWLADRPDQEIDFEALSPREVEILAAAAAGVNGSNLEKMLNISQHTNRTHQRNIRQKLGAKTLAQAVQIAIKNGLIPE